MASFGVGEYNMVNGDADILKEMGEALENSIVRRDEQLNIGSFQNFKDMVPSKDMGQAGVSELQYPFMKIWKISPIRRLSCLFYHPR